VKKLSGVAVPSCSCGSSHREANPACQASTSLPFAAEAASAAAAEPATIRIRTTASTRDAQRTIE
jgi:hypothetical protein